MPSTALDDAGLVPGDVTEANDDDHRRGQRHQLRSAADAEVAPGSAVGYVRLRSVPRSVAVPDIVDLPEADALADARRRRPGRR